MCGRTRLIIFTYTFILAIHVLCLECSRAVQGSTRASQRAVQDSTRASQRAVQGSTRASQRAVQGSTDVVQGTTSCTVTPLKNDPPNKGHLLLWVCAMLIVHRHSMCSGRHR